MFQIVACLWSETQQYFRAKVLSTDPGRKKARVLFIDYGNTAIEKFANICALPPAAINPDKFPALANIFKLVRFVQILLNPRRQAQHFFVPA